ncbi:MAG: FmdE family protein [Desulfonatronovibrionaceae bacterium]
MSCTLDRKLIDQVIDFHGHNYPGLSIGIRASELALNTLDRQKGDCLTAVVETDMCAVDAIQYLTGCTFGKGNLIHRDLGKVAFSFYDPENQQAVRIMINPSASGPDRDKMRRLMKKSKSEELSGDDKKTMAQLRQREIKRIMEEDPDKLFELVRILCRPPRPARVMDSHECSNCREMTMETRIRLYDGQKYCIPCFDQLEQKT